MNPIILTLLFVAGALANTRSLPLSYGAPPPLNPPQYNPPPYNPPPPKSPPSYAPPPYNPPPPKSPPSYAPPPYNPPPPKSPPSYAPPPYAPPPPKSPPAYGPPPPRSPPAYSAPAYGSSSSSALTIEATHIPIISFNHDIQEGRSHKHSFQTGHGISHEEHTQIHPNPNFVVGTPEDSEEGKNLVTKTGSVSYTSPEGQQISLSFQADKDGFRASGAHLPVPPTQPPEIVKATQEHQIAFDAAAKAAAEAPEEPLPLSQRHDAGAFSYGGY